MHQLRVQSEIHAPERGTGAARFSVFPLLLCIYKCLPESFRFLTLLTYVYPIKLARVFLLDYAGNVLPSATRSSTVLI